MNIQTAKKFSQHPLLLLSGAIYFLHLSILLLIIKLHAQEIKYQLLVSSTAQRTYHLLPSILILRMQDFLII